MATLKIVFTAFFLFILLVVGYGIFQALFRGEDQPKRFTSGEALAMCQTALRQVSHDPDKAEIPFVENLGDEKEFSYSWGGSTKRARMRNGLGMDVAVTAHCAVNAANREIVALSVNGQVFR